MSVAKVNQNSGNIMEKIYFLKQYKGKTFKNIFGYKTSLIGEIKTVHPEYRYIRGQEFPKLLKWGRKLDNTSTEP
ncbi:hypothetical protein DIC82_01865 [Clostridium beijerinckii]|nr:hypothetical protein DIC82_01865 [Clostridium beijerinckii]